VREQIRTPLIIVARTVDLSITGETIRDRRTRTYQIPLTLLAILIWAGWRAARADRLRTAGAMLAATAVCGPLPACGGQAGPVDRPEREVLETAWDTVMVVESLPDDTLFFEVRRVVADSLGIRVLDGIGYRVARVSWEGRVIWYAGRRGAGPGELLDPRAVAVDAAGRTWVLDVGTHRITGFDDLGRMVDEVSLSGLEFVPHEFAVDPAGERFFVPQADGGIRPVEVRRDGSAVRGARVTFPGSAGAPSLALQGDVRARPGSDRWLLALAMGDGFVWFEGLRPAGEFTHYVEHVPLATVEVTEEGSPAAGSYSRTQLLVDPVFASESAAVTPSRILVQFGGRTPLRDRLLDVYGTKDGAYRGSLVLPGSGIVAAWEDRLVLARNDPHPHLVVLRPSAWP
jgi:hypothetical protein